MSAPDQRPSQSLPETLTQPAVPAVPAHDPNQTTETRRPAAECSSIAGARTRLPDSVLDGTLPCPELADFRVVQRLGRGGMGDVFEVFHERLKETFALKMIRPDKAEPALIERFYLEARAMMHLDHPNVPRFFHIGETNGCPYITMRCVKGMTLSERIKQSRLTPREALLLMEKVTDAVRYVHERHITHRDLKPSNILVDEAGQPFVCDFGLVKFGGVHRDAADGRIAIEPLPVDDDSSSHFRANMGGSATPHFPVSSDPAEPLTRTGAMMGTYSYMSPEQMLGDKERVGPKSDIWSLGVILYELLTGKRPFTGEPGAQLEKLIRDTDPPPPSQVRAGLDPALDRIVMKCLRKKSEDRYGSTDLLLKDLRRWLHSRSRRWLLVSTSLCVLGTGAAWALGLFDRAHPTAEHRQFPDREKSLAEARADLAENKTVRFIEADGAMRIPWKVVAGKATIEQNADGSWTIDTTGEALVELMDEPGIDAFTLVAEMRENSRATIPDAGVYIGRRAFVSPKGEWHFLLDYRYRESADNYLAVPANDSGPPRDRPILPKGVVIIKPNEVRRGPEQPGELTIELRGMNFSGSGNIPQFILPPTPVPADKKTVGGPWRKLTTRANWQSFSLEWDDGSIYTAQPAIQRGWMMRVMSVLPDPKHRPSELTARGGFGIHVSGGSVTIRSAEINPGIP